MYTDDPVTRRFLVADEVGLGKTLVARGLIARAVDHLWDTVPRIDVVYICSNADIAQQNLNRLRLPGWQDFSLASRITLLPLKMKELRRAARRQFRLLHARHFVRHEVEPGHWRRARAALSSVAEGLESQRAKAPNVPWRAGRAEKTSSGSWITSRRTASTAASGTGSSSGRTRRPVCVSGSKRSASASAACDPTRTVDRRAPASDATRSLRSCVCSWRKTCLSELQPDLIILDEFQRFKHLLATNSEAGQLAGQLFNYADAHSAARVVLLSATPYKMYTLTEEAEGEDHYQDFVQTVRFLLGR